MLLGFIHTTAILVEATRDPASFFVLPILASSHMCYHNINWIVAVDGMLKATHAHHFYV